MLRSVDDIVDDSWFNYQPENYEPCGGGVGDGWTVFGVVGDARGDSVWYGDFDRVKDLYEDVGNL